VFMKLFGGGPYGGSNTCFYPWAACPAGVCRFRSLVRALRSVLGRAEAGPGSWPARCSGWRRATSVGEPGCSRRSRTTCPIADEPGAAWGSRRPARRRPAHAWPLERTRSRLYAARVKPSSTVTLTKPMV